MKLSILILLGLAYILNSIVLKWAYPNVSTDYDQYVAFVATRNIVYEAMFAVFFLLTFLLSERILRATACFFMVLSSASVVDKCLFGITQYLKSDILLVVISMAISILVYAREVKR
jgi:hypothetical protein